MSCMNLLSLSLSCIVLPYLFCQLNVAAIVDGHSQSPLPPSPPIYGHKLVGSDEAQEKKRFLMMLEKANLLPNEDAKSKYFDEGGKTSLWKNRPLHASCLM